MVCFSFSKRVMTHPIFFFPCPSSPKVDLTQIPPPGPRCIYRVRDPPNFLAWSSQVVRLASSFPSFFSLGPPDLGTPLRSAMNFSLKPSQPAILRQSFLARRATFLSHPPPPPYSAQVFLLFQIPRHELLAESAPPPDITL